VLTRNKTLNAAYYEWLSPVWLSNRSFIFCRRDMPIRQMARSLGHVCLRYKKDTSRFYTVYSNGLKALKITFESLRFGGYIWGFSGEWEVLDCQQKTKQLF